MIYSIQKFRHGRGAVALLQLLLKSNLADTFPETMLLLKTIITVPITICETEKCFSTLKRLSGLV